MFPLWLRWLFSKQMALAADALVMIVNHGVAKLKAVIPRSMKGKFHKLALAYKVIGHITSRYLDCMLDEGGVHGASQARSPCSHDLMQRVAHLEAMVSHVVSGIEVLLWSNEGVHSSRSTPTRIPTPPIAPMRSNAQAPTPRKRPKYVCEGRAFKELAVDSPASDTQKLSIGAHLRRAARRAGWREPLWGHPERHPYTPLAPWVQAHTVALARSARPPFAL